MLGEQIQRPGLGLPEQVRDLTVDTGLGGFGERTAGQVRPAPGQVHRPAPGVPDRAECGGQPVLADHLGGQLGGLSQVVATAHDGPGPDKRPSAIGHLVNVNVSPDRDSDLHFDSAMNHTSKRDADHLTPVQRTNQGDFAMARVLTFITLAIGVNVAIFGILIP